MNVDDLGLGQAEVVGEVDECVGFGGADLPVEQGCVEHGQVGVGDRFTGARDPVDEPGQEVWLDMTEGGALHRCDGGAGERRPGPGGGLSVIGCQLDQCGSGAQEVAQEVGGGQGVVAGGVPVAVGQASGGAALDQ